MSRDTVLIIDDDAQTRRAMARVIEGMGYKSIEAGDGYEGIERYKASEDSFVAVTLNLVMPIIDGKDTLGMLSKIAPFLPIVISSGLEPGAVSLQGRIPGSPGIVYLPKPYDTKQLQTALERVIAEMKRD
jgi:CheY-like chemotaxis protein